MIESNTYINLILMKPYKQDKMTRSQSIRARMRAGGVKFDKDADWYQDLEEECISFPRAKHDDQVDSLAYLGLLLDKLIDAPTEAEAEDERYLEEFNETGNHMQGRNAITGY
jgi:phage terminase large subunit-like protein